MIWRWVERLSFAFIGVAWVAQIFGVMVPLLPMPFARYLLVFGFCGFVVTLIALIIRDVVSG